MDQKLEIPGITDPATLATIARSRTFRQYEKAVDNALDGVCPFCFIDRNYNNIAAENRAWRVLYCNPPEKNTRLHFLFVPKRHVTSMEELTDEEVLLLFGESGIRRQMHRNYNYRSCGTLVRDGYATLSAGTIQHLHFHDMVPDGTGRVETPFYKGQASEEESLRRAIVFEKIRQGVLFKDLTSEEMDLVRDRV